MKRIEEIEFIKYGLIQEIKTHAIEYGKALFGGSDNSEYCIIKLSKQLEDIRKEEEKLNEK